MGQEDGYSLRRIPETKTDRDALDLAPITAKSLACVNSLARYKAPPDTFPSRRRRAAVMIALFSGRNGDLHVVLTQRDTRMHSHAGETALPGGKMEDDDVDLVHTARREAWEEVGLPMDENRVRYLTTMSPFLSRKMLLVTPVICFITDSMIQPNLNPSEVAQIFSHPFEGFLKADLEPLLSGVMGDAEEYHTTVTIQWPPAIANEHQPNGEMNISDPLSNRPGLRGASQGPPITLFHKFTNKKSPIVGLTSAILVEAAAIGYNKRPEFDQVAEGQWPEDEVIRWAIANDEAWKVTDSTVEHDRLHNWASVERGEDPDDVSRRAKL